MTEDIHIDDLLQLINNGGKPDRRPQEIKISHLRSTFHCYRPLNFKDVLSQPESRHLVDTIAITGSSDEETRPIRELLHSGRIPGFFLQGITAINIIDFNASRDSARSSNEEDHLLAGRYVQSKDSLNATGSAYIELDRKNYLLSSSVLHEIGHNAHALLSESELSKFLAISQNEQIISQIGLTDLTDYVTAARQEDLTGNTNGYGDREDFAETFMLFVDDPYYLLQRAPEHYAFMKSLFLSKLPLDETENFLAQHTPLIEKAMGERVGLVDSLRNLVKDSGV